MPDYAITLVIAADDEASAERARQDACNRVAMKPGIALVRSSMEVAR